jgi:hypothetical protein
MEMHISMLRLERRARHLMAAASLLLVLIPAAFHTGLIAAAPTYNLQAWYAQGGLSGFVVTSEYADEAECRRNEKPSTVCRSGAKMMKQARREAN